MTAFGAVLGLRLRLLRGVDAGVLVEVLLRNAVKGKRRDRALEARSRHTPRTLRTAVASELFVFDPDQAFVHTSTFLRALGLKLGGDGWNTTRERARKVNSCPSRGYFQWNRGSSQVTNVLRRLLAKGSRRAGIYQALSRREMG